MGTQAPDRADQATGPRRCGGPALPERWRTRPRDGGAGLEPDRRRARPTPGRRALRNMVRIVLTSRFSMWAAWGPELTTFYNDAYWRDTLQAKHPWALGRPAARDVGGDLARHRPAHPVGPRHRHRDLGRGPAALPRAQRLPRGDLPHLLLQPAGRRRRPHRGHALRGRRDDRAGRRRAPDGQPAGSRGRGRHDAAPRHDVLAAVAEQLGRQPRRPAVQPRRTCSTTPAPPGWAARPASRRAAPAAPSTIARRRPGPGVAAWPGSASGEQVLVDDLAARFPDLPTGAWQRPPDAGRRRPARLVRAGARRRLPGSSSSG